MQIEQLCLGAGFSWRSCSAALPESDLILYFGATDRVRDVRIHDSLRHRFPRALIAGASAGSQILQGNVNDDEVVAVAVKFGATRVRGVCEPIADTADSIDCGRRLGRQLSTMGKASATCAIDTSGKADGELAAVFVLSDGLTVNGTQLAEGLASVLGPNVALSGGLAGDGPRFGETLVGLNAAPRARQVVAIGLYGNALRVSHAAAGGWNPFGPSRRITKAAGNVLFELDGKPALDLYERYLGEEAAGLPGTALLYPLNVWHPAQPEQSVVRTVLGINARARSMTFAGDLAEGWRAQLMRGAHEGLINGAADAAHRAVRGMASDVQGARLALLVSCVGRRLLMGQRTSDEVTAVRRVLGSGVGSLGFYSYGELAPRESTGRCDLHNQTMTVTMLAESVA